MANKRTYSTRRTPYDKYVQDLQAMRAKGYAVTELSRSQFQQVYNDIKDDNYTYKKLGKGRYTPNISRTIVNESVEFRDRMAREVVKRAKDSLTDKGDKIDAELRDRLESYTDLKSLKKKSRKEVFDDISEAYGYDIARHVVYNE